MTLAMALDNSFEIMNEEEMYDVNGGWTSEKTYSDYNGIADAVCAGALAARSIMKKGIKWMLSAAAVKMVAGALFSSVSFVSAMYMAGMFLVALIKLEQQGWYKITTYGIKIPFKGNVTLGFYVNP